MSETESEAQALRDLARRYRGAILRATISMARLLKFGPNGKIGAGPMEWAREVQEILTVLEAESELFDGKTGSELPYARERPFVR